jgi:hypothetical protein
MGQSLPFLSWPEPQGYRLTAERTVGRDERQPPTDINHDPLKSVWLNCRRAPAPGPAKSPPHQVIEQGSSSGMLLTRPDGGVGRSSSPSTQLPRALRALAHEAVVTEDGPHPAVELGAVAARCEPRRSRRPCHPRAIRSGHERYPTDSHGHFEEAVGLGARP